MLHVVAHCDNLEAVNGTKTLSDPGVYPYLTAITYTCLDGYKHTGRTQKTNKKLTNT